MSKSKNKIQVGDRVATSEPVEALYSGYYQDCKFSYPYQWLQPGMIGKVLTVQTPYRVGRGYRCWCFIEFEGAVYGTIKHPVITWHCWQEEKYLAIATEEVES